ncbi:MAG: tRNA(5-methylaminomethyl-2-thiouridylate) methyltransferase [Desulfovibrio sp.]|jgi:hypothetical protein|nr:tRNA(5-methylaminomethyl-2-thiouridylate) methyltransferase [Desulfovibrio sp.]
MKPLTTSPDIVVLFSGGLDSLLTAKLLQRQGLSVRCWHAFSPFFGKPRARDFWRATYGLDVHTEDVGEAFAAMLRQGPSHGFGKVLNPCVDCKIHLLRRAKIYMESVGAQALASGEVPGQRPMSQRRDVMRVIAREAGVADILVRPLGAGLLEPSMPERKGLVDRSRLASISGRGRAGQFALAARFGITEIPTPAGGCRLTDRENARRYWPLLTRPGEPTSADFDLANLGRQFWARDGETRFWLCVGRNKEDNEGLAQAAKSGDALLFLRDMPGPTALARDGAHWPSGILLRAAKLTAFRSPRAVAGGEAAAVCVKTGEKERTLAAEPEHVVFFEGPPSFDLVHDERRRRFPPQNL